MIIGRDNADHHMNQLERNKKTVTEFYDLMFNQCRPKEAIEWY